MRRKKNAIILVVFLFCCCFKSGSAQTKPVLPYVINSAGGYGNVNGFMFDFNFGETVLVQTFNGVPNYLFSQGFLQPFFITPPLISDVFVKNNVITPNGDGSNDFFVVDGLDKYPDHKFSVFDRGGRVVFSSRDYKNNFDGRKNGSVLNEETYYYVIDLGKNYGLLRGFISIVLDNK